MVVDRQRSTMGNWGRNVKYLLDTATHVQLWGRPRTDAVRSNPQWLSWRGQIIHDQIKCAWLANNFSRQKRTTNFIGSWSSGCFDNGANWQSAVHRPIKKHHCGFGRQSSVMWIRFCRPAAVFSPRCSHYVSCLQGKCAALCESILWLLTPELNGFCWRHEYIAILSNIAIYFWRYIVDEKKQYRPSLVPIEPRVDMVE